MAKRVNVPTKYFDVTFDGATIKGKTNMGSEAFDKDPVLFSASPALMSIQLAMNLEPKSLRIFMSLADGYGKPGFFPSGYDWSGIRDSSPAAVAAMQKKAKKVLALWRPHLKDMGLPSIVIDVLTGGRGR